MRRLTKIIFLLMVLAFLGGVGYIVYDAMKNSGTTTVAPDGTTTTKETGANGGGGDNKDPKNGEVKTVTVDGITYSRADFPKLEENDVPDTLRKLGIAYFVFFGLSFIEYYIRSELDSFGKEFKSNRDGDEPRIILTTSGTIASFLGMSILYYTYAKTNDTRLIVLYTLSLVLPFVFIFLAGVAAVAQFWMMFILFSF